ncbi:MAG TPA: hypothetical protein VHU88_06465 [Sporichthyaceae bacterium]|jgi:hypothetical protein|nr:hypothetical protein [Sporichthyaceae bacterium]
MNPLTELQQTPAGGAGEDADPAMGGAYRPLTEEVRQAARRTICARANDVADARELLLALGLIPVRSAAPVVSMSEPPVSAPEPIPAAAVGA